MFPSCGWSSETFILETGPIFRRSMCGYAITSSMNFAFSVMTEAASV